MDEPPITDEPEAEPISPETGVSAAEKPTAPAQPEVVFEGLATGKEPWRGGSGCSTRLPAIGCVVLVIVLIGFLMGGTSMTRKTVWMNFDKGMRSVMRALPPDLPPEQRVRTTQNLDRFRRVLEKTTDPYPKMGEFMRLVRAYFSDQRLTTDEIEELNLFLEKVIEDSGIPMLQLGEGMRIEESGMRNAAHRPRIRNIGGWAVGNSSLLIPHSSFV